MTNQEKITALATFYYSTLTGHHKDRDCHFFINSQWSYNKFKGFYVEHNGYINEYTDPIMFKTYESAEEELIRFLKRIISTQLNTTGWDAEEWAWSEVDEDWYIEKRIEFSNLLERII